MGLLRVAAAWSIVAASLLLSSCVPAVRYSSAATLPAPVEAGQRFRGIASYYHDDFEGRITASGERFSQSKFTAAHSWLPFGTVVRVTNLRNGKSVVVRITDRGPHVAGRIIDLSRAAAAQLGMLADGTAEVEITVVELPN